MVEPGDHLIMVGASSADIRCQGTIALKGDVRHVKEKVFASEAEVVQSNSR